MAGRYKLSEEEFTAIQKTRKKNKDKCAEQRLKAMELRAKGSSAKEVATATGFCVAYISQLWQNTGSEALRRFPETIMAAITVI